MAQRGVDDRYGAVSPGGAPCAGVPRQSGGEYAGEPDLCADRLGLGAQWRQDALSWLAAAYGVSHRSLGQLQRVARVVPARHRGAGEPPARGVLGCVAAGTGGGLRHAHLHQLAGPVHASVFTRLVRFSRNARSVCRLLGELGGSDAGPARVVCDAVDPVQSLVE